MIGAADRRRLTTGMPAALLLAGLLLARPPAGAATTPDPQSLLLEARQVLQHGDVEGARSSVAALRQVLQSDARWDPDGCFAERLLPDLEARIARLRTAIEQLESLPARLREENTLPGSANDPADPESDLAWGELRVRWVLEQLDRIASTIPPGPERGALLQSAGYLRATELIGGEVLPELADSVRGRFDALGRGDERVRALKARMDALKREVIDGSVERERLEEQLEATRGNQDTYRQVLIEFIGDDPETAFEPSSQNLQGIGLALARRIREVWTDVHKLERQTPSDKALLLREIECLRRANVASVSDGSRDLGARIDALAVAVEAVPVTAEGGTGSPVEITGCMAALRP